MENKNKFFTHKVLPVFSILLLALFVFTTSCFATSTYSFSSYIDGSASYNGFQDYDTPIVVPDFSSYLKDDCYYYIYTYNGVVYLNVYLKNDNTNADFRRNSYSGNISINNVAIKGYTSSRSVDGSFLDWELTYENESTSTSFDPLKSSYNILAFNFDIQDSGGNVLFHQAPVISPTTVLAPIIQEQETSMGAVLQEIMEILPIVLIVVVSLLGVKKCLKAFGTFLRVS